MMSGFYFKWDFSLECHSLKNIQYNTVYICLKIYNGFLQEIKP